MHALRALALLAPLVWSCAGPSQTTRYQELEEAWLRATPAETGRTDDPFAGHAVLDRHALIAAVLARNPSIESARWAWRAALARHPQETSLDDPMLEYGVAPASLGSSRVDAGHRVALSQALPFPGKLALRGEIALAEAEASARDHDAVRLRLATLASLLFDEYYLVEREARGERGAPRAPGRASARSPSRATRPGARPSRIRSRPSSSRRSSCTAT